MTYGDLFDYDAQPKQWSDWCHLCGASLAAIRALRGRADRYGFHVGLVECTCGLVFLNPRMTAEAYARFYESGAYRKLVSAFHGREINADTLAAEQYEYAKDLWSFLAPFVSGHVNTVLDVGGSTGVVGATIAEPMGARLTVLDPSSAELAKAAAAGHSCVLGMIEDFDPAGQKWDLVLFCQTADHVLDLMGTLRKLKDCTGGWLYVDILDFNATRTIKIDHPYYLTERTMRRYLDTVGLDVVLVRHTKDNHIGFLCRGAK